MADRPPFRPEWDGPATPEPVDLAEWDREPDRSERQTPTRPHVHGDPPCDLWCPMRPAPAVADPWGPA